MATFKKISYALLAFLFITVTAFGQKNKKEKKEVEKDPTKYKKLENSYAQEKYAQCLFTALKYQDNDKYNKDPEPYLYASMCYLAVYKDPDPFPLKKYPEFSNPLKDALSNFAKFKKRDKTGEVYEENKSFADELRGIVIQESSKMYEKKDVTHLTSFSRDIAKAYDKDNVMMMISGGYLVFTNNMSDGLKNSETAITGFKKDAAGEKPKFKDDEEKALANAFVIYTDYLFSRKDPINTGKAKDAITVAHDLLPANEKISKQFEKINGGGVQK